jgi:hypothetical protein
MEIGGSQELCYALDVIKFLSAKKFTLNGIRAELASICGKQAYAKKAVE